MVYVILGIAGIVVVVTGMILAAVVIDPGGLVVSGAGGIVGMIGLMGYGFDKHRDRRHPQASPGPSAKTADSPTGRNEGQVAPVGHVELTTLRANKDIPEEFVRAEWDAACEPVSESLGGPFRRGVLLSIERKEGEERDLRCIVTAPDGTRHRSVRRLAGFRFGPSSRDTFHWPGEFEPKPQTPWTPGYYSYAWSGDTGDIADDRSDILARRFFYVDEDEIITCHREVAAEAPGGQWRATYELRRDPKYGPGVTLSIRSRGETFGHFRCRVTNPRGAIATAAPRTGGYLIRAIARTEVTVHYPRQFRGAVPTMPPGEYIVEWYGLTGIRPDDAQILLARITFDVPEGYRFASPAGE